ncbi:MAG: TonB-dependent receptor plug domain-containing protein [Acidobacteriota bacterium]|nr:TonB-dependent receptor plug domain-containing protein [Acidobacteriota bacterium]
MKLPPRGLPGALALLPLLLAGALDAQETGTVFGRILDQDTFQPVVGVVVRITTADGVLQDISGPVGTFHIMDVPVGERVVVMEHIAYGEYAQHVAVEPGRDLRVNAHMSQRAIEFQPLVVEALSEVERRRLTSGFDINEIPREEIELAARGGQHLGDLLRGGMPGIRVRGGGRPGDYLCVEYRGSGVGECDEVSVYLDGVPVGDPGLIYSSLDLSDIDRVEVLSPLEAVTRFGNRASGGALLIESRDTSFRRENSLFGPSLGAYDWSLEEASHPWAKVLGSTILANAAGVGLGYLALKQCVASEPTTHGRRYTSQCGDLATISTGIVALNLPGTIGGFASSRAGATQLSRGRYLPAAMAGLISTTAGYVMVMRAEDPGYKSDSLRLAGLLTMTVGTPLLLTLSDRLFRTLR